MKKPKTRTVICIFILFFDKKKAGIVLMSRIVCKYSLTVKNAMVFGVITSYLKYEFLFVFCHGLIRVTFI